MLILKNVALTNFEIEFPLTLTIRIQNLQDKNNVFWISYKYFYLKKSLRVNSVFNLYAWRFSCIFLFRTMDYNVEF